jgi:hypothetical protein
LKKEKEISMSIVCPKCEKSDSIQKISAICAGGTSSMSYEVYGSGSKTAISQTQLAEKLGLSKEPPEVNTRNMFSVDYIFPILFLAAVSGFCSTFAMMGLDFSLTAFGVIFTIVLIIGLVSIPQTKKKAAERRLAWERQRSNWLELYYCHRDDCVFDPRTNKYTSPEGMSRLL